MLLLFFAISTTTISVNAKSVSLNIGPQYPIQDTKTHVHPNVVIPQSATGNGGSFTPAVFFRTSRSGRSFKVYVTVPVGSYDLHFGFVETRFCRPGGRVMHVHVDGQIKLESYDIFKAAGNKCNVAVLETVVQHAVSVVHESPVAIKFSAVSANAPATVSSIRITPSFKYPCNPVTTNARIDADHLAHAVPRSYRPVVDRDDDGSEVVFIDGRGSHTHFSFAAGSGKILYYVWTDVETRQVVSRKPYFYHRFSLGTTRLRLTVIDGMCTSDDAETTITVTSNIQPGQYCYIYDADANPNNMPMPGNLLTYKRPIAAGVSRTLWTTFPPNRAWRSQFIMRCVFFLNTATPADASKNAIISVTLAKSGTVKVYKGQDLILDSTKSTKSQPTALSVGMTRFEMVYRRTDVSVKPVLMFAVNGKVPRASDVTHDQAVVLPIVTSVTPPSGAVSGGTQVQITGYGLYAPLKVYFGATPVFPNIQGQTGGSSRMTLSVRTPPGPKVGDVTVFAENSRGMRSNRVKFAYDDKCDAIGFGLRRLRVAGASKTTSNTANTSTNDNVKVEGATSIVIGADGRLYIGTISGIVNVVEYDPFTFIVKSRCSSEKLVDRRYKTPRGLPSLRSILGITFDPRDDILKPYISLSTIFWGRQKQIPYKNKKAWMNGAVVRLKPSTSFIRSSRPWQCLQYDTTVVRNLPVSDGDHAVNDLEFTQTGDLLISVGGFTNAGLPSQEISSMWEAYFSGAVVIARLSRGSKFNGTIPYTTPTNPRTARPITGYTDVGLYATGTRNLFTMTMTRGGRLLGVDMGTNCEFGDAASSCSEYKEQEAGAKPRIKYKQGLAVIESASTSKCPRGPGRGDKLLEILPQRFYGHPNLQRAKLRPAASAGECAWVDPLSGKRTGGGQPPGNYMAPLAYFTSAKTGAVEYGSNFFCGRLRGQIILTTNSGQGTWRLPLHDDESKKGKKKQTKSLYTTQTFDLSPNSGIRVVENEFGALLYPQYYAPNGIVVNIAKRRPIPDGAGLAVTNALPFRHGRKGGTRLRVTGHGFMQGVTVRVAGRVCGILSLSTKLIVCRVPMYSGGVEGKLSVDVSVTSKDGKTKATLERAVLYMKV